MEFTSVLIKPLVTEKSQLLQTSEPKKYAFVVNDKATKEDIKQAFLIIYGFTPKKIATLRRKAVSVRTGTAKPGYSKLQKIAYITMPKGKDIAISAEDSEIKKEANAIDIKK